jgi:hypothetical protein
MNKNLIIIGLLAISIFLVLSGCTNSSEQLKDLSYTNTEYEQKFGFNPPEGWTKDENDAFDLVRFYGPTIDEFTVNLGLSDPGTLSSGENLNSLVQDILDNYPAIITNYLLISEESLEINGMNAHEIIYTMQQGVYDLKQKQVVIECNNVVYALTYTASQNSFEDYESIVDQSISTFKTV